MNKPSLTDRPDSTGPTDRTMTANQKLATIEEILAAPDLLESEKYDRILDVVNEGNKFVK
jgi:hypothetical protein